MARRLLITSLSVGGGHGRAGECVAQALAEQAPDWEVRQVDLRDVAAGWFRLLYVRGYLVMVRRLPWLWGLLYRHPTRERGTLPPWLIGLALRRFQELVEDFQPDAILCTQVTASEAVDRLRSRGLYRGVTATVVTDFDAHPTWRADGIDRFFVPDAALRDRFIEQGFSAEQVEATGVPIAPVFASDFDRAALRRKYGLREGVPAVLLMGGSLGLGLLEGAVHSLLATGRALDLLVVAGHNEPLRQRLEAMAAKIRKRVQESSEGGGAGEENPSARKVSSPASRSTDRSAFRPQARLQAFGFIDFVHELMAAADLFVSKPGGLSMTEAVTVGVPVLGVHPLPGQEEANLKHLAAQGVLRPLGKDERLADAVLGLLDDSAAREEMAAAAEAYAPHAPAERIAARLIELVEENREPRT